MVALKVGVRARVKGELAPESIPLSMKQKVKSVDCRHERNRHNSNPPTSTRRDLYTRAHGSLRAVHACT